MANSEYILNQLLKLCPVTTNKAGQIKIKLQSELGETNWINITQEQLHEIEGVLCKGAEQ